MARLSIELPTELGPGPFEPAEWTDGAGRGLGDAVVEADFENWVACWATGR